MKRKTFLLFLICFVTLILADSNEKGKADTAQWFQNEITPDTSLVDSLNNLCFELRGSDPARAIFIGKRALEYAHQINYTKGYLMSHSFIGVSYRNISDYTSAMNYYTKCFYLADSLNDLEQKAYSYNNIGNLFLLQQKDSLALRNILNAMKLGEEINDQRIIAYSQINLGRIYANLGQWEESIKYLMLSVERRRKLNDSWGVANTLIEIAEVYMQSKRYNLALKTFDEAKEIAFVTPNSERLMSEIYKGRGIVYLAKESFANARRNFQSGINLAKVIDDKRMIMENYQYLSQIFERMDKNKKAIDFYKKYIDYKDSVYTIETQNHVARLAVQYQTKEMDSENQLLRKNNEIQNLQLSQNQTIVNFLLVITVLLIILGGIIFTRFRAKQRVAGILKKKNTEILKQKMELAELNATKDKFFSIIGHDLRNPFGSLIGNTEYLISELEGLSIEENKQILNAIRNSSKSGYDLLENLLIWANSQQGKIVFSEEKVNLKELVEANIDLHKNTAVLKDIHLHSNVEADIEIIADEKMLHTILNNLINNALKFTSEEGEVKVSAEMLEKEIEISIKDTGTGMSSDELSHIFKLDKDNSVTGTHGETGTGLGLIICKEFVDAHSGLLKIESEYGEGTDVKIILPIKNS